MRIVITFVALEVPTVTDGIPWPWYAGAVVAAAGIIAWVIKLMFRPLMQAQTGQWVPRPTVDLMIKAKDEEIARLSTAIASQREDSVRAVAVVREEYNADMAAIRAEHIAELTMIRDRHDRYMKAMDENHAREAEGTRRDSADWRTAYHIAAEVNKVKDAQLDELIEGNRLILSLIQALPKVQAEPQSDSPEVNDRAGRGLPGR